jgi:hypothetical protein
MAVRNAEDTPARGFTRVPGESGDPASADPALQGESTSRPPWEDAPAPDMRPPDLPPPDLPENPAPRGSGPYPARPVSEPPAWPPQATSVPAAPRFIPNPDYVPETPAPQRPPARPDPRPGTGPRPVAAPNPAAAPQLAAASLRPAGPSLTSPAGPAGRGGSLLAQVPYVIVLACTVAGVLWAWRGAHDVANGAGVVGGALLVATAARLLLPQSAVGLLANRRRFADVLALGVLGTGLVVLALVLPPT